MTSKALVDGFVSQPVLALAGLSRSGNKFSNGVFTELKQNGFRVLPVNPQAETIQGERCYPSLSALPEKVEAVLIMTPPAQTAAVVQQAVDAGIKRVWIQQGAESPEALALCKQHNLDAVSGECIMMFAGKAGFHKFHKWIWGVIGKLPK